MHRHRVQELSAGQSDPVLAALLPRLRLHWFAHRVEMPEGMKRPHQGVLRGMKQP